MTRPKPTRTGRSSVPTRARNTRRAATASVARTDMGTAFPARPPPAIPGLRNGSMEKVPARCRSSPGLKLDLTSSLVAWSSATMYKPTAASVIQRGREISLTPSTPSNPSRLPLRNVTGGAVLPAAPELSSPSALAQIGLSHLLVRLQFRCAPLEYDPAGLEHVATPRDGPRHE